VVTVPNVPSVTVASVATAANVVTTTDTVVSNTLSGDPCGSPLLFCFLWKLYP
jgi:hypothetical protein